ncbi:glyoxylase-like metal-dependent hydrolase (beta-lactamase superfamily II) [Pseudonocardia sediminis]|uniref:Glyoxylase-like metal-dependent hydrolase (Beta-lactamase superfamily II) n=1 Tax=Pseudonocardia sediminis TaxID=1397368 RepID=A0A4Q7UYK2_PSEST|nr:MBL fold metallo-hydrolase [Pseudonocardia sediminis]RZT86158.1 glyoxylase-like metal-dependent hydrolase (beta-lactamase superfamily II) [Pseudonocardia sediminis]
MLVAGFPAGSFRTNCFVLAPAAGGACVVVDPGQDAVADLDVLLAEHSLTPAAVLLTHGHLDHTYCAAEVADAHGVPVWIHPDDRAWLTEPMLGMSEQSRAVFGDLRLPEPGEVRDIADDATLRLAGLELGVAHTPGHTPGSVCFTTTTEDGTGVVFGGDTLFQGSVGRTDLPGGSHDTLLDSIAARLLSRDDTTIVLPGHGPATTIGAERAHNPFLADLTPTRGRAQ